MRSVFAVGLAGLVMGCSTGGAGSQAEASGSGTERTYQVAAFQKLGVEGPYDVEVRQAGQTSVRATGPSELLNNMIVRVDGDTLRIEPRSGFRWSGDGDGVKVYITTPNLAAAALAGSGDVSVDRAAGERFEAALAGSGDLQIGQVEVGALEASIAGSGDVRVAGRAERAEVSIAGSGDVDASGLASRRASVSIAGSGNAAINASEAADVAILGSGDVTVTGGARCTVSRAGSGNVNCG